MKHILMVLRGSLNSFWSAETHRSQGSQVLGNSHLPRCVYFWAALGWNEGATSIPGLIDNDVDLKGSGVLNISKNSNRVSETFPP